MVDEVSIRDGLVHAFVGRWTTEHLGTPHGPEVMRGHALECMLLSSMAIGGLLLGCPPKMVARHMAGAQRCLAKFRGLSEQCVVSSLILYGVSNALVSVAGSGAEYRKSMDEARTIFDSLEEKDPVVGAFIAYRATCDNLIVRMDATYSVNPANIVGRDTTDKPDVKPSGGAAAAEKTEAGWAEVRRALPSQAHPAYVVADGG